MNARMRFSLAFLAAVLMFVARPAGAGDVMRSTLDLKVNLTQPALADGSVRLSPGAYDVRVTRSADGSVRAGFFQGGVKRGEANGIVIVNSRPAGSSGPGGQRAQGAGPDGGPAALWFSTLGLDAKTPYSFVRGAGKVDLVIGNPGANQILIGLLLPGGPNTQTGK